MTTPLVADAETELLLDAFGDDGDVAVLHAAAQRYVQTMHFRSLLADRDLVVRRNNYMYFLRPDLHLPDGAAFSVIRATRNDMALLNLCRVDWSTFDYCPTSGIPLASRLLALRTAVAGG